MNNFNKYLSNTYVGSCNNFMLFSESEREISSRMFFRVIDSGKLPYKFYYRNILDSTYSNGAKSHSNLMGDRLSIKSAFVGTCDGSGNSFDMVSELPMVKVTFNDKQNVELEPGEDVWTDEVMIDVQAGQYLVFEWTVEGRNIPFTPDKKFPCYIKKFGEWVPSNECPQPSLIGCDREVKGNIAFWGDSITQGLQTRDDLYEFWVAEIGKQLPGYAVWNLGLGFGRIQDAATLDAWFDKAKNSDMVSLCFGVNDLREVHDAGKICEYLNTVVDALVRNGVKVGIFTIPPCSYEDDRKEMREVCNKFIKNVLAPKCIYCFDVDPSLGLKPPYNYISHWNAHPNAVGCKLLADNFIAQCGHLFK